MTTGKNRNSDIRREADRMEHSEMVDVSSKLATLLERSLTMQGHMESMTDSISDLKETQIRECLTIEQLQKALKEHREEELESEKELASFVEDYGRLKAKKWRCLVGVAVISAAFVNGSVTWVKTLLGVGAP